MKLFKCPGCDQLLSFENTHCVGCGGRIGYLPEADVLAVLDEGADGTWRVPDGTARRFCDNARWDVCNWLVPAEGTDTLCTACRHNVLVPDVGDLSLRAKWRDIEAAKHRLIYSALRLGLPLPGPGEAEEPLVFKFPADPPDEDGPKVMTGHDNGVVTIALAEADDSEREARRMAMGEPYRTLIGHFRHEVGHFYWDRLVRDGGRLAECRAIFGDDSQDYETALKRHYEEGAPADWAERHISSYATVHPWEDFAETWAHYFHIVDTLEMADSCGLAIAPRLQPEGALAASVDLDVYAEPDMRRVVDTWLPVAFGMNAMNRCMGQRDLYPFVIPPAVVEKLAFVHDLVQRKRGS